MVGNKPVNVAILRPKISSLANQYDPDVDAYQQLLAERMDAMVDVVHDMLLDAAETTNVRLNVTQYQLHHLKGTTHVVSPKRARAINFNDVLVTVDPTTHEFAYVHNALNAHALQRGVVAFTALDTLEDLHLLLGAKRTPIFIRQNGKVRLEKISRLFPFHLNLNADLEAATRDSSMRVIEKALSYPNINSSPSSRSHFMDLVFIDPEQREAEPEFRLYLTGEEENN